MHDRWRARGGFSPGVLICQKSGLEPSGYSDSLEELFEKMHNIALGVYALLFMGHRRSAALWIVRIGSKTVAANKQNILPRELGSIRKEAKKNMKMIEKAKKRLAEAGDEVDEPAGDSNRRIS